ncbi:hypothetical protein ABK040_005252 [Willaertia magna]
MNQLPSELLFTIIQYIDEPKTIEKLRLVNLVWRQVIDVWYQNIFWKEKLFHSNWLLNKINCKSLIVSPKEYDQITKQKSINYYINNNERIRPIEHFLLKKRNQLLKQWENDYVKYWTSNSSVIVNEDERIFKRPLEMTESGIVIHGLYEKDPSDNKIAEMIYKDIYLLRDLENNLILNHKPKRDNLLLTWKDPSTLSAVNNALIPILLLTKENYFDNHNAANLKGFFDWLGVNKELYSNTNRYNCKRIIITKEERQENNGIDIARNNLHALLDFTNTTKTINFNDIFPNYQFNDEFVNCLKNWMERELNCPTIITLGINQLNPLPIFILGMSKESNHLVGFLTSSFRLPHQ